MKRTATKSNLTKPALTESQGSIPIWDLRMSDWLRWSLRDAEMFRLADIPQDLGSLFHRVTFRMKEIRELAALLAFVADGAIDPIRQRREDPLADFEMKYLRLDHTVILNMFERRSIARIADLPLDLESLLDDKSIGYARLRVLTDALGRLRQLGEKSYLQMYMFPDGAIDADAVARDLKEGIGARNFGVVLARLAERRTLDGIGGKYRISRERVRGILKKAQRYLYRVFRYECELIEEQRSSDGSCALLRGQDKHVSLLLGLVNMESPGSASGNK